MSTVSYVLRSWHLLSGTRYSHDAVVMQVDGLGPGLQRHADLCVSAASLLAMDLVDSHLYSLD